MAYVTLAAAKSWTETTKVGDSFSTLNSDLEKQVSALVLGRLRDKYNATSWTDDQNTPKLILTIMAMYYVSFMYDKTYSTDDDLSAYAVLLRSIADNNIAGLLDGTIDLDDDDSIKDPGSDLAFYPNDSSSALEPTSFDSSLGDAKFSMGSDF